MKYILPFVKVKKLKYGNTKTVYGDEVYDSKKEARKARELDTLKKGKVIKDWQPHYKISIDINGKHICNIFPDFYVEWKNGDKELIEIKSSVTMTSVWRLKRLLLEATYLLEHPDIKYTVES